MYCNLVSLINYITKDRVYMRLLKCDLLYQQKYHYRKGIIMFIDLKDCPVDLIFLQRIHFFI